MNIAFNHYTFLSASCYLFKDSFPSPRATQKGLLYKELSLSGRYLIQKLLIHLPIVRAKLALPCGYLVGVHGVKKLTPPPLLTFNACLKYLLGLLLRTKNADPRLLGVKNSLLASSFSSHLSHAGSLPSFMCCNGTFNPSDFALQCRVIKFSHNSYSKYRDMAMNVELFSFIIFVVFYSL